MGAIELKRLTFKPEFVDAVRDGTKRGTLRWKPKPFNVGDVVAAVTSNGANPAFLTKAEDRFALLKITKTEALWWEDVTDAHLAATTVTRDWYLRENPTANHASRIYYYEWEAVKR